jgi:hypothetical protein
MSHADVSKWEMIFPLAAFYFYLKFFSFFLSFPFLHLHFCIMSTINQLKLLFEGDSPDQHLTENHSSDDSATVGDAQDLMPRNDDGVETYTKAQWKSMSPKERRQLRNKISARNFRTRRKGMSISFYFGRKLAPSFTVCNQIFPHCFRIYVYHRS